MMSYFILFCFGIFTSTINVVAGGGSLVIIPLMIFLGIPPAYANGTNRVALTFQTTSSLYRFSKSSVNFKKDGLKMLPLGLLGTLIGSLYSVSLSDQTYKMLISFVMIFVAFNLIFDPFQKVQNLIKNKSIFANSFQQICYLLLGLYLGLIQAGVGFLIMGVLHNFLGFDLKKTNALKIFFVFFINIINVLIFAYHDKIYWDYGLALGLGTLIGGYLGTNLTLKLNPKHLKRVLLFLIVFFSLVLLLR